MLLQGVEPSLRWRRFSQPVVEAARELGVEMVITLGALLADVPHTRPVPITGLASDDDLVERLGFERSTYEGPTGIVGVLHHACARGRACRRRACGPSVPHYVAAAPNPKAALALVRALRGRRRRRGRRGRARGVGRGLRAPGQRRRGQRPRRQGVRRAARADDGRGARTTSPSERIPSADTIARDFQRFLRQRGPEG